MVDDHPDVRMPRSDRGKRASMLRPKVKLECRVRLLGSVPDPVAGRSIEPGRVLEEHGMEPEPRHASCCPLLEPSRSLGVEWVDQSHDPELLRKAVEALNDVPI